MKSGNLFDSLANFPDNVESEIFDKIVDNKNFTLERIISKGHSSPTNEWYLQERCEWVIVIQGEAILEFENNEEVHMSKGSHLTIPAKKKHRVKWTAPSIETIWLALHYTD